MTAPIGISQASWIEVRDGHPEAAAIFRRHYTYNVRRAQMSMVWQRNRNYNLFVGPGQKLVLLTADRLALFVWRKFISGDAQEGVNCAVFRNEGPARASDLIGDAMDLAWKRWPGARLYTYVNPRRVRSANPGYCFLKAGWGKCGLTKRNRLLIMEASPMTQPKEVIAHWIITINDEGRNLSKWEIDFMDSVTQQFELRGSVSDKQEETIERIYADKTP